MKIIPKKINIKKTVWKNYSIIELLVALIVFIILFLLFTKKYIITSIIIAVVFLILYFPLGDEIFYETIFDFLKYLFSKKKYQYNSKKENDIYMIKKISNDGIIDFNNNCYARVIKIGQKNFMMQDEDEQNNDIEIFNKVLKQLEINTSMDIVKIDRPINFDDYLLDLNKRIDNIIIDNVIFEKELILSSRKKHIESWNFKNKKNYSNLYIVIYCRDIDEIDTATISLCSEFQKCGLSSNILSQKETAVFLKYQYMNEFNENEVDNIFEEDLIKWIYPENIKFYSNKYIINNNELTSLIISDYPSKVKNGWGEDILNIPNTKVVMHIDPIEKNKAIKKIDSCILEMETKEILSTTTSETKEANNHSDSLKQLLTKLQNENESLLDVTITITCTRNNRSKVKKLINNKEFKTNILFCNQINGFINSLINPFKKLNKYKRSINSMSLASSFPFIKNYIMDDNGILLGKGKHNDYPFIFDIWKRGELYQNSNAFVIGKSGSGKTYFLKNLIVNEWSNNTRIIICDPEAEYLSLTRRLNGNIIDVGNAKEGILNPFHIYQILTEDGVPASPVITFNTHLKTLESFFKIVLNGVDNDVIELINMLVIKTYEYKGITEEIDCCNFKPSNYPIFSNLLYILETEEKKEENSFLLHNYSVAKLHLQKFVYGRYSDIWNSPSTLKVDANIISFNFQSLFANKNNVIANAQMLLVFRFIEQEIINSREKNKKGLDLKTMIIVDEAHLFIDSKYPIALDFFYQMNKRIRKYNGAFIPTTQNISDWNSNQEVKHKTSTIIKNSQYTFIFKLSAPDMQDLLEVYKLGNSFNKEERKLIISAITGQTFFVGSTELRDCVQIIANDYVKEIIE